MQNIHFDLLGPDLQPASHVSILDDVASTFTDPDASFEPTILLSSLQYP